MNSKKQEIILHSGWKLLIVLLCIGMFAGVVSAAATTSVDILRIADDGKTVLAKETVTVEQMKADFPIQGDGVTLYTHQGPIFEGAWDMAVETDPDYAELEYDKYDPLEKLNYEDGQAAYRGTSVKDLASVVGGIPDDAKVGLRASDGMERKFSASYIKNPEARMGPMVLCWERDGSTTDKDFLRMYFFAEDDHIFGATDMHETMPDDEYWYNNQYPSARGLSVQNVAQIRIYTYEPVPTPTPTQTQTPEPTTVTPTQTQTPEPTTVTPTQTQTPEPTTVTPTQTQTPEPTTVTPTQTQTPEPTTVTPTQTQTPIETITPFPTDTQTPSSTSKSPAQVKIPQTASPFMPLIAIAGILAAAAILAKRD